MAENVVLNNLANLQNDTTTINTINGNNATITAAFSDVLSRTGISPNTMGAPLDMNSWPIMNLPAPGSANSPARLVDVTGSNPIAISLSLQGDVSAPASSGVLNATVNGVKGIPINSVVGTGNLHLSATGTDATTYTSSSSFNPQLQIINTTNDSNAGIVNLQKSRSGGAVLNGDALGLVTFQGFANGAQQNAAIIEAIASGSPVGSNIPTNVQISTSNASGQLNKAFIISDGGWKGTVTNDNATAGNVGEYISSTIAIGSTVSLTTATPANITFISLTAGDWDVWINGYVVPAVTTNITVAAVSVSTTSATINTTSGNAGVWASAGEVIGGAGLNIGFSVNTGPIRLSLPTTTTVFFVGQANFTVSTCTMYGTIQARRVR